MIGKLGMIGKMGMREKAEIAKENKTEPILRMDKLSKRFGGVQALKDVSFDVFGGDVLGIIGPNGSGKTTIVNAITGFITPTSGKIFFKGKDITGRPPPQGGRHGGDKDLPDHAALLQPAGL